MGKYFHHCNDGKCRDFCFKKREHPTGWVFSLDEIRIGIVTKNHRNEWCAVPLIPHGNLGLVDGFKSRLRACFYLVQLYDAELEDVVEGPPIERKN